MATWDAVVTNGGNELMAEWLAGTMLELTGAATGSGTVSAVTLMTQTALVEEKEAATIISAERVEKGIKLKVQITAAEIAYTANQIGVRARIGEMEPVLLALFQQANGVLIPSRAETPDFIYNFYATIVTSNVGQFTFSVDPAAIVSQSTLSTAVATAREEAIAVAASDTTAKVNAALETAAADATDKANQAEANAKAASVPAEQKGAAGGIAELDESGHVPDEQLPSSVKNVLEYSSKSAFPATGESGKIYVAIDTNKTYRWGGSTYTEIAQGIALGETAQTAYRGDRGKAAYDHAQATGNPHGTKASQVGYTDTQGLGAVNLQDALDVAAQAAKGAQTAADAALDAVTRLAHTIDAIPTQNGSLTYTGSAQTPSWNSYNPDTLTLGGVTTGTSAGTYTATFTPKEGYTWSDGTSGTKSVVWAIGRASIAKVPSQGGSLTFTGSSQSPTWNDYNSAQLTIGGTTSATAAGNHSASFVPTANYQWSDGTTEAKTATWTIGRAAISTVPSQSGSLTYTGSAQTPNWSNYDSAKLTIGGTKSGTNAGSYTATFTPTSNYMWSDGSTGEKSANWSIGKAAGSLSLNKTSLTLTDGTPTGTIAATRAGSGTISATSSNTSIATVSVSGNTVTVTGKAQGSVTVTISVAADSNYNAPASKTCSVSVQLANVFGVQWNYGSSSTALTRLTKTSDPGSLVTVNITTEPKPAVGTGTGSSPFDSYAPWNGMEEYNIVNNAVSYKKGTSGFSRTGYDTVVFIPEFYFKIVDDASGKKRRFYISDKAKSGFTKHPGSGRYVGRYDTISGNYSKSGAAPYVSMTRAAARSGAKGKGAKWYLYDYASWCALWLLYLVEFSDWNCQTKIGRGYVDGNSAALNSGATDSMSYHTGRPAGTDGKTAVQYRHVENPWGNVRQWLDGINFNDRATYICTNPANYADDTATNYTAAGVTLSTDGWPTALGMSSTFPWAYIPTAVGGSETTYIPDYMWSGSGWRLPSVGGYWGSAGYAGWWCFYASYTSSSTGGNLGARLLFVP